MDEQSPRGLGMQVGSPFNPYKVFRGVFAPFWLLEHRGISSGAKLCYIRLLGFAGKDARCYPSLDRLAGGLGVSDRQVRDYVKELERSGLIAVEQRGLRKTNVYQFLWTAELENLFNSVPDGPDEPDEGSVPLAAPRSNSMEPSSLNRDNGSALDRNPPSTLDRNRSSTLDQNRSSGLDRKLPSGPKGINSGGIRSMESSSSSGPAISDCAIGLGKSDTAGEERKWDASDGANRATALINDWAISRKLQRLRSNRQLGPPEKDCVAKWVAILESRDIHDEEQILAVLDRARTAADECERWRNWSYLTLQVQLAAERFRSNPAQRPSAVAAEPEEAANSAWAKAKTIIRSRIPEPAFLNWFAPTRQIHRQRDLLTVAVPDEPTRCLLQLEYKELTAAVVANLGIRQVTFVVPKAQQD